MRVSSRSSTSVILPSCSDACSGRRGSQAGYSGGVQRSRMRPEPPNDMTGQRVRDSCGSSPSFSSFSDKSLPSTEEVASEPEEVRSSYKSLEEFSLLIDFISTSHSAQPLPSLSRFRDGVAGGPTSIASPDDEVHPPSSFSTSMTDETTPVQLEVEEEGREVGGKGTFPCKDIEKEGKRVFDRVRLPRKSTSVSNTARGSMLTDSVTAEKVGPAPSEVLSLNATRGSKNRRACSFIISSGSQEEEEA
mmetsp:Transcript_40549/g.105255  ORF Transcript_40549/g.105255 Transcript_40549/m.105255 type:complete len:247 (-) Transcript_40549:602-1342(-)